ERRAIDTIVAALGFHTLAVKLAAARAGQRDLATLAREYEADPRLGVHLKDGTLAVEAVLASSVGALPPAARRLFVVFGAFKSSDMGRQALLAIAAMLDDPEAQQSLEALLDLRLLDPYTVRDAPEEADRERLKLHPLVAEYASERFGSLPSDAQLHARRVITQWYVRLLARTRTLKDL